MPKLLGVFIAYGGMVLLFADSLGGHATALLGDVFSAISGFLLGARHVYNARMVQSLHPAKLLLAQAVCGTVSLMTASLLFEDVAVEWTTQLATSVLYQGVVVAGFCFIGSLWLLKRYFPSQVSVISLAQPLFSIDARGLDHPRRATQFDALGKRCAGDIGGLASSAATGTLTRRHRSRMLLARSADKAWVGNERKYHWRCAWRLDGRQVVVAETATVLDAALAAGIEIPHLCKDADQPPIGACRTCLVEVEGGRGFPASCHTPVLDDMVVRTRGAALERIRNGVLALTRAMQPAEVAAPAGGVGRELGDTLDLFRLAEPLDSLAPKPRPDVDDSNPIFQLNHEACIMCGRCTTACEDIQHIGAISIAGTAQQTHIAPFMDQDLIDSICTTCGQCVSVCPTGALHPKPTRPKVARQVKSVCAYCGVGCGITMQIDENDRLINVHDDPTNQSSQGMLCVKGRFGLTFIQHEDRLTTPLIRKNGVLTEASWGEALDLVAEKFAEYRGSFASLASAKATNEDGYVQQKLVRLLMGTNNIDHCTRLCHSPSVEAMIAQLGSGATSNSYADYRNAGCLMVVGSDTSSNHPVIASQLRQAIDERGAKLIVVNPKRIDLCNYTDLWLRPNPGTDVALFNGLARAVLDAGLADEDFIRERTEGFAALEATLEELQSRGGRADHRRPRRRHSPRGDALRTTAVRRLLSHLGHGHHPAHERHRQCLGAAQPGPRHRPDREAGHRRLAAAGPEQRPRLRRCGLHSQQATRLSEPDRRHTGAVRAALGGTAPQRGRSRRHRHDGGSSAG